jgi:hypothetical protein
MLLTNSSHETEPRKKPNGKIWDAFEKNQIGIIFLL